MKRSKVTIHMYTSIDGKIDGPHGSEESSHYYSNQLFHISNADANGSETIQMYAARGGVDLSNINTVGINYDDWLPNIKSTTWSVSFDRKGKCNWTKNFFEYNGHKMHTIEIVTKQASLQYLGFLRKMKIPYIVGGVKDFNLKEILEKLKEHFNIETLAVCGGAIINGLFLRAHLVDQISLVVAPHVNGSTSNKSVFDTFSNYVNDSFCFKSAKPLSDGGVHVIFDRKSHQ